MISMLNLVWVTPWNEDCRFAQLFRFKALPPFPPPAPRPPKAAKMSVETV
jgi:hypothetical protein